jgi:penicillin-binding protein 1A
MSTRASSKKTIAYKIREFASIERPWFRTVFKTIWILFFCFLIGFPLYIYTVSIDLLGLYGGMPSLKSIENPENDLSSELISADGVLLGRYARYNRVQVAYEELSPELINTLIISEDHRYHDHSGMDFWAFMRVAKGLLTFSPEGGGSTITQQLAKNLYTQNEDMGLDGSIVRNVLTGKYPKRIFDKTKEWIISVQLEKNFTKEEIIAMYLNTATFGSNAYGIQVAAETYFNKSPDSLNIQESAVLVGMLQAVTRFNPVVNPEQSLSKRNEVMGKLFTHGHITRKELDSLRALPIVLQYKVQNQNVGLATYFRSVIGPELRTWARERGIDLEEAGLKIYTTIDSRMQQYAEEAVTEHMAKLQAHFAEHWKGRNPWLDDNWKEIKGYLKSRIRQTESYRNLVERYGKDSDSVNIMLNLKKPMRIFTWSGERDTLFSSMDSLNYYKRFLNTGFMSMDAHTGEIKAWVGGINHKYFKYDHVKQGKRQPGSTFKAFVYGTAMESGWVPCHKLPDVSPSFDLIGGGTWMPKNADGLYGTGEMMTLREAMALSVNSITAQVMKQVSPANVVNFAKSAGITSPLEAVPALCLGVNDVSLYELVGAYGSFVNEGIYTEPFYITRIEDKNGNVLESRVPKTRQAMKEQDAFKMIYMLMGGVEVTGGTSYYLPADLKLDNEIGGKTGTTNNASDGWYMGVTKDLVSGAWVGGDEKSIHYRSWDMGQGSRTARPIWVLYMRKVYADATLPYKKGSFKRPPRIDFRMDCSEYYNIDPTDSTTQPVPQQEWTVEH